MAAFENNTVLAAVKVNGKYGYINKSGSFVIAPSWDDAGSFSEGLAPVKKGEKWGYIDTSGKLVIPCKWARARSFEEGLAVVGISHWPIGNTEPYIKYRYIDKTGKYAFMGDFWEASNFNSDGFASVEGPLSSIPRLINRSGLPYIPVKQIRDVISGRADSSVDSDRAEEIARYGIPPKRGSSENGKYGFKNSSGSFVIPPKWDFVFEFQNGIAVVEKDDKYGYIDQAGNYIVPCYLDRAGSFSEGLAAAEKDGIWGYLNRNGRFQIPCRFQWAGRFVRAEKTNG